MRFSVGFVVHDDVSLVKRNAECAKRDGLCSLYGFSTLRSYWGKKRIHVLSPSYPMVVSPRTAIFI